MQLINTLLPLMMMGFFQELYQQLIKTILTELGNIMSFAADGLSLPIVKNGMLYAQILATSLIVPKAGFEIWRTYVLFQEGDPDGDVSNSVIRAVQGAIVVWLVPLIIKTTFDIGSKINYDVSRLSGFDGNNMVHTFDLVVLNSQGWIIPFIACVIIILVIVVYIQTVLRAADLAGTAVIGAIMATNLTNTSHSAWSAWFRQVVIICCSQAIQIFFLAGAFYNPFTDVRGMILTFGWMVACIKSPKWLQQFAYSTGLGGAVGGTTKTAGTMIAIKMMTGKV